MNFKTLDLNSGLLLAAFLIYLKTIFGSSTQPYYPQYFSFCSCISYRLGILYNVSTLNFALLSFMSNCHMKALNHNQ